MLGKNRLIRSGNQEPDVNPMDGLSNLADVMLVLAVGIMLALIINWNVDISTAGYSTDKEGINKDDAVAFSEDEMQPLDGDGAPEDGEDLKKLGAVYYDETSGTYYIIQNEDE